MKQNVKITYENPPTNPLLLVGVLILSPTFLLTAESLNMASSSALHISVLACELLHNFSSQVCFSTENKSPAVPLISCESAWLTALCLTVKLFL